MVSGGCTTHWSTQVSAWLQVSCFILRLAVLSTQWVSKTSSEIQVNWYATVALVSPCVSICLRMLCDFILNILYVMQLCSSKTQVLASELNQPITALASDTYSCVLISWLHKISWYHFLFYSLYDKYIARLQIPSFVASFPSLRKEVKFMSSPCCVCSPPSPHWTFGMNVLSLETISLVLLFLID